MTARTSRFVTFDLDGTLVRSAFESWVIPEIGARLANGRPSGDVARRLVRRHLDALGRGDALEAYDWQGHADALAADAGLASGTVDVTELVHRHTEAGRAQLIFDEAPAVLQTLRENGWQVSILTNGFRAYQEPVLRWTGLWDVVDRVITTDDVGHAKPDQRAFDAAFSTNRPAVHVGDRLDHDVQGANRASVSSLLLTSDAAATGLYMNLDRPRRDRVLDFLRALPSARSRLAADGRVPDDLIPDAIAADIADLPRLLEEISTTHVR